MAARRGRTAGFIFDIDGTLIDSNDAHARTMVVGDTPYDILAAHRIALPIVAVRSGGFDDSLLQKAEFLFKDTEEMTRRLDQIDDYFSAE